MLSSWAYLHTGRMPTLDHWEWFGLNPVNSALHAAMFEVGRKHEMPIPQGPSAVYPPQHMIATDGERWIVGQVGLPSGYLDKHEYPPGIYAHENVGIKGGSHIPGRVSHHFHGYQSQYTDFPEHIPDLPKDELARLHEKNIIPLWRQSDEERWLSGKDRFKTTTYGEVERTVPISEHLPDEAIAHLRQAHAEQKPAAVLYHPETRQYQVVTDKIVSEMDHSRRSGNVAFEPPVGPAPKEVPPPAAASAEAATVETVASGAAERSAGHSTTSSVTSRARATEESWAKKLWEHPAGKFAVVGGVIAIGAIAGRAMMKPDRKQESPRQPTSYR